MAYRVLIADDEGIMRESLKKIIQTNFPDMCEVTVAKTGLAAIEMAEANHPDIVFMDIQMPGINGIEALREIRKFNKTARFYILSAYDKFDYAKEAISLGVERYLTKPVTKKTIVEVIQDAMDKVDDVRQSRSDRLRTQEKLEIVIPVVESGFISTMLVQNDLQDASYFMQLLDVHEEHAYILVFQYGTEWENGHLITPVGASIQAQNILPEFRSVVKSHLQCVVGNIMSNQIVVAVPTSAEKFEYEERVRVIENVERIVQKLEEQLSLNFRAGIGRIRKMEEVRRSYQEADRALRESQAQVVHINDITSRGFYEGNFPSQLEHSMMQAASQGRLEEMRRCANQFFDWMVDNYPNSRDNIRLKVLEFVIVAEREAFREGAVNYGFELRENYLSEVCSRQDYEQLRAWFLEKMADACTAIRDRKNERTEGAAAKAQVYIRENYKRDISLDDVSREVNVSPYYFSKLFKEETGENFIEYLTRIRIDHAKELLRDPERSIKEISRMIGYADPNYFSRIFKKQTEMTPREFRVREAGIENIE